MAGVVRRSSNSSNSGDDDEKKEKSIKVLDQILRPILEDVLTEMIVKTPEEPLLFLISKLCNVAQIQDPTNNSSSSLSSSNTSSSSSNPSSSSSSSSSSNKRSIPDLEAHISMLQQRISKLESTKHTSLSINNNNNTNDNNNNNTDENNSTSLNDDDDYANDDITDEEEEEEEVDEDDIGDLPEIEQMQSKGFNNKMRTSVSAEVYGHYNQKGKFTPPFFQKTADQEERIRSVLKNIILFQSLENKDMVTLVHAMQEKTISADTIVIQEGDDGDNLYVVEKGDLRCYKKKTNDDTNNDNNNNKNEEEEITSNTNTNNDDNNNNIFLKTISAGDAFGELALLYNCPRAASVKSKSDCVLWCMDRETFNHIVKEAAAKRREMYDDFLKRVRLLDHMDVYQRSKVADGLKTEYYQDGEYIMLQGDDGDKFYFIEEGEAIAYKSFVPGQLPQETRQYKEGDYFGELALLKDEPRAASIVAKGTVKLAMLHRKSFNRLLGPLQDILCKKAENYQ